MMHKLVIVGARHRTFRDTGYTEDDFILNLLVARRRDCAEDDGLCVLTQGCDEGIGKKVKDACNTLGVPMIEYAVWTNGCLPMLGDRGKLLREACFISRHAALLEIGTEFHVLLTGSRASNIEDLVSRLKMDPKRSYVLYDGAHKVAEKRNFEWQMTWSAQES